MPEGDAAAHAPLVRALYRTPVQYPDLPDVGAVRKSAGLLFCQIVKDGLVGAVLSFLLPDHRLETGCGEDGRGCDEEDGHCHARREDEEPSWLLPDFFCQNFPYDLHIAHLKKMDDAVPDFQLSVTYLSQIQVVGGHKDGPVPGVGALLQSTHELQ